MKTARAIAITLIGLVGAVSLSAAAPRLITRSSLKTMPQSQLWHVGWRQAAMNELIVCDRLRGHELRAAMDNLYAPRERWLKQRIGLPAGLEEEIIMVPPPCATVRGSVTRYDWVLDELQRRVRKGATTSVSP